MSVQDGQDLEHKKTLMIKIECEVDFFAHAKLLKGINITLAIGV
jgi:hypothetical protein